MAINFTINGKSYRVLLESHPIDITLNTFLREHAHLSATKFMCLEGGCGVCICVIKGRHPQSKEIKTWATNSCLTLLNACDGWDIITAEGLGNKKDGYHPIQERLAHLNGSQCGYCSPAMVMNMYGLLESKGGKVSMAEVENSFGGNMCRCTGYRPILDAMKSFATNSDFEFFDLCADIEDMPKNCPRTGSKCAGKCRESNKLHVIYENEQEWFQANSLEDVFAAFKKIGPKKYMLVAGNTAHGVYRRLPDLQVFIAINQIPELHSYRIGSDVIELGGSLSLTETMEILQSASKNPGFAYCRQIVSHIDLVANVPVRNMGTLAGNLSIKHTHREFPSDIFISLEAVDAKIVIMGFDSKIEIISAADYLNTDMAQKVLTNIVLNAKPESEYFYNSYKIMPRAQNAHGYVNAGFLLNMTNNVVDSARICFGGINPDFVHAIATENFLKDKELFKNETVQGAIDELLKELHPDHILPDASPEYRKILAAGLLYKFILGLASSKSINPVYKSGGDILHRPLSSGSQTFETQKANYPLTQPIPKIEALVQCSGESFYMNDIPTIPHELWAAFVHATQAKAKIVKIDPSEALKIPGVEAFYSAKDIPGLNSFVVKSLLGFPEDEEIFCSGDVKYHSQPIGVIVAETLDLAKKASEKVHVLYEKLEGPVMSTMDDVFKHKAYHRITDVLSAPEMEPNIDLRNTKKIQGNFDIGSQYHYTMEPQTCVCIPTEDGMDIFTASQWMDIAQIAIANALDVKENSLYLQVRRLGGGYGGKISRNIQIACACALASKILNRPVRFVQSLESMMSCLGKRLACHSDYEADFDDNGKIVKLKNTFFEDCGCTTNENPIMFLSIPTAKNCYAVNGNWKIDGKAVVTDAPSHTWCRAPGALEGIAMIENIIEHIARESNQDPADVRIRNLAEGNKMQTLLPEFLKSTGYRERQEEIKNYNKENRWRKRGLGIAVMKYPIEYFGGRPALVSIYQGDGTVSISHGGIEMGQGMNTKAAQVAAFVLGIPLEMIRIHPSDSFTAANAIVTGGGVGSETACYAIKKACEELLLRMKPVRDSMKNPTWQLIVRECHNQNISLIATHNFKNGDLTPYDVWGLCISEVEVDILTGNLLINRVDILEDTGESLSPFIDIGQVEGAFIMGVGYWLTEKLVSNRQTGESLTNRTWTYKPPGVKDIPVDFRITLLQNSPNPGGFLRSKATGEPASCLSVAVLFALRHALESARDDAGIEDKWFHLGAPTTPEDTVLQSGNSVEMFKLI